MVANWDGTIADIDPEFLHDLRVAVRRTRVVLANAGRVLPDDVRQRGPRGLRLARRDHRRRPATSTSTRSNGPTTRPTSTPVRPRRCVPLREHLGELTRGRPRRARGPARVGASRRRHRALERVARRPGRPGTLGDRGDEAVAESLSRRRIRRAHRRMIERGRTITPATPAETVHELRKDAKKLRYLIECFGGLYDKSAAHGVRRPAEGAAGHPRRAPGRRGPRRTPCATIADDPQRRWSADTLLAIGQLIERLEQRRVASRDELAERFADVRQQGHRRGAEGAAGERADRRREDPRHLQHQGRRRQDHRGRQPRLRGGVDRCPRAAVGPRSAGCGDVLLPRQAAASRAVSGACSGTHGELAASIKESDVAGLHLVPADFSLRHLDVHLDDANGSTATPRRRCSSRSPTTTTSPSSTAPRASRSAARRCSGAADALLVPTVPTTLSVRTLDQLDRLPRRRRRRAARSCRSCRCSIAARRCTAS